MAIARRVVRNPSNYSQMYILYDNGYIQAIGGAPPVPQQEAPDDNTATLNGSAGSRPAPTWYQQSYSPAVALQVTDWTTPGGYVLSWMGKVFPFGSAADVPGSLITNYYPQFVYTDLAMNPAADGTGYALVAVGDVIAMGAGTPAISHGQQTDEQVCRRIQMEWSSKKYIVMDTLGRFFNLNGASAAQVTWPTNPGGAGVNYPVWNDWFIRLMRDFEITDWTNTRGWAVDAGGTVWSINSAASAYGYPATPGIEQWEDLAILQDGTGGNPLRIAVLTVGGWITPYVVSSAPSVIYYGQTLPADPTTDTSRPNIPWGYYDPDGNAQAQYEVRIITDAVYQAGATSEVQRLTTTGTPTGGTFTLVFDGQTTATIPYNASAAQVQTALRNLRNIGSAGVSCSGGSLPTAVTITFAANLGYADLPQLTVGTNSLTGGSSPAPSISTTTPGVGNDPATMTAVWSTIGTEIGKYGVTPDVDLANDTYRAYIRVTDSSGLTSAWRWRQWTQNVAAIATPTLTVSAISDLGGIRLAMNINPAGLPANTALAVQYQDSDDATWYWVRGGTDLVPDGSGNASVVDYEARFGITRTYRCLGYVLTAFRASPWSTTANGTLNYKDRWALINPFSPSTQCMLIKNSEFKITKTIMSGTFFPAGRSNAIVINDGRPKSGSFPWTGWALSATDRKKIEDLFDSAVPLLLKDPFGRCWYVMGVESFNEELMRASPTKNESTSLRDAHQVSVQCQAVARPSVVDSTSTLATLGS